MYNSIAAKFLFLPVLLIIIGCKNYSVSINENEIYSPSKLFTQFSLKDTELQRCVDAIIKEEKINNPNQLTRIVCPAGNIHDLDGLEIFANITQIGLKENKIASISPLAKLKNLQQIDLSENPIASLSPLLELKDLTFLNIENIEAINCEQVTRLKDKSPTLKVLAPKHCHSH